MNKAEALARVAGYMAGIMQASDLEESTGLTAGQQAEMSEADLDRLDWARGVVIGRLYRMGRAAPDSLDGTGDDGDTVLMVWRLPTDPELRYAAADRESREEDRATEIMLDEADAAARETA